MFAIVVAQDMLGRKGEHRADQTFRDVGAVLGECTRLHQHLTVQDQTIVGIVEGEFAPADPGIT